MRVLIAGDFCPKDRVASMLEKRDFASVLGDVKDIVSKADYSFVNFECPVVTGNAKPIEKLGPNLKCSEKGLEAIRWAGFNCVTLANNHFYDYGDKGVTETLDTCERLGIDYVGGGRNIKEAVHILNKNIGNQTLAIINCCEHEFSIATESTGGANPLNPVQQYYAIKEAKKEADRVLVIVHGGHEHFQLPSPRMVETYRFFIDAGADAVVNHHQHCYSGYEVYNGKPIFYGIGNFCFDNPQKHNGFWTEGYAITIDLTPENPSFILHPYIQCADDARVKLLPKNSFDNKIGELNNSIVSPNELLDKVNQYYAEFTKSYSDFFEPFRNRFYISAKHRGWLPSFVKKRNTLLYRNHILCESHRDKLSYWLIHK